MTIKVNQNDGVTQSTMTGGETTVDFDFPITNEDHIELLETNTNGVLTTLAKGTHFTVPSGSVNQQAGGTLTLDTGQYPSGAIAGHKFTARLKVPEARTTDFQEDGDFFAATVNKELDLITQQIQQLRRDVNASATFREDIVGKTPSLPEPADNQLIAFEGADGTMKTVTAADLATSIDTLLSSIANNEFLVYQAAGAVFVNKTITQVQALLGVTTNNYIATTDPTADDDELDGYSVGSRWINNTDGDTFFCKDASQGAAVWETDSLSLGDLGGVVTKDFTTSFTSPDNTTVPGTQATKDYVDGKDPVLHAQARFANDVRGYGGSSVPSGSAIARPINHTVENEITGAGVVFDLPFDAQTANFTPGQVVTGGTSGATATIATQTDNGTDGTLKLIDITGTFTDNETITDPLGGSASVNSATGQLTINQIWLPANTYRVKANASCGTPLYNNLFVYDVTGDTELVAGLSGYNNDYAERTLSGKFTLTSDSLIELRHHVQQGGTAAFGIANTNRNAAYEIYLDMKIWEAN